MTARLQIRLLGGLAVRYRSASLELGTEAARDLAAFLLLNREVEHRRERVATLVCGRSCTTAVSRKRLRNALWQLRVGLSSSPEIEQRFALVTDTETISLTLASDTWVDVDTLQSACEACEGVDLNQVDAELLEALEFAANQYRGPLLDGFARPWCEWARERSEVQYFTLLGYLFSLHADAGRSQRALDFGHRILRLDPAHELTHQGIMKLYARRGDRARALRQFDRCRHALNRELDAVPSKTTEQLRAQIASDSLGRPETGIGSENGIPVYTV